MRKRVYIAGPITHGDLETNITNGREAAKRLISAGYAPLCPQLTCYLNGHPPSIAAGFEHDVWLDVDLRWVEVSDALLRLPGPSKGADMEVAKAEECGIPVYTDIETLITSAIPDPRFNEYRSILAEMEQLHCKKSKDYGTSSDPYANVRASEKFGVPAWVGAQIRKHDKTVRIQSFLANGTLANESLEDALLDSAVYAVISLLLYRRENKK